MKITKKQLKRIVKEELEKSMLTLEMFDTSSAGDAVGGSTPEEKEKQRAEFGLEEELEEGMPMGGAQLEVEGSIYIMGTSGDFNITAGGFNLNGKLDENSVSVLVEEGILKPMR